MRTLKATIAPRSAFSTPLKGDTLFGQLCWALRNRLGEERLVELLVGYTEGQPFAVISDAFPVAHLPRPTLPGHWLAPVANLDRKAAKKRLWLPAERVEKPVTEWLHYCVEAHTVAGGAVEQHLHPHNAVDRRTGTTGEGFAPYDLSRCWYPEGTLLDIHIILDEARLAPVELKQALDDMGELGFGHGAGIGLGRFRIDDLELTALPSQNDADAWLTLAPCAPQGQSWREERCFYSVFTRFGRHGGMGVHKPGGPFKSPVLLADTGAVLSPSPFRGGVLFAGRGLGGDGSLSKAIPETVHQGYAPVIALKLPQRED